ncbi:hypothetical protein ASF54_12500 [Frondihabitans sp. Leaf304]|nr:hypothetical protein ASF54_12500 [Frondihabitans sp. Leaf304]
MLSHALKIGPLDIDDLQLISEQGLESVMKLVDRSPPRFGHEVRGKDKKDVDIAGNVGVTPSYRPEQESRGRGPTFLPHHVDDDAVQSRPGGSDEGL